jgi:hypothetical protein
VNLKEIISAIKDELEFHKRHPEIWIALAFALATIPLSKWYNHEP